LAADVAAIVKALEERRWRHIRGRSYGGNMTTPHIAGIGQSSNRPGSWSDTDEALLVRVWTSDLSVEQIVALFPGHGEGAVRQRAKKLRKAGLPIGERPITYGAPTWPHERRQFAGPIPGAPSDMFADSPQAADDHGSAGSISRAITRSPSGCSAAF
jgi:hypothetical protein